MIAELDELTGRRDRLLGEIRDKIKETDTYGNRLSKRIQRMRFLLWGGVVANFLVGVFSPWIARTALPPIFTLLSGCIAACSFLLARTAWRKKSQAFFACRDNLQVQASRLDYQQHIPTPDGIAAVARERDKIVSLLGQRLGEATREEDQQLLFKEKQHNG